MIATPRICHENVVVWHWYSCTFTESVLGVLAGAYRTTLAYHLFQFFSIVYPCHFSNPVLKPSNCPWDEVNRNRSFGLKFKNLRAVCKEDRWVPQSSSRGGKRMQRDEITLVNHFKMDCIIYFYIQTKSRPHVQILDFVTTDYIDSYLGFIIFTTCKEFSIL